MLHKISSSFDAELRNVMAFQRAVLVFACDLGTTTPLLKTEVVARFGPTADWLWAHNSLHQPMVDLNLAVRASPALAARIIAAFDNDIGFDARIADGTFGFACCALPQKTYSLVHSLLVKFYDLLGSEKGFPSEITAAGQLTRGLVVQRFWISNASLNVCPACDGPRPDRTNGKVHAQCDHFLPKGRHPALSVHPRNLVPVCTDCNMTFKGERDANDHAHLSEMFLPYDREAFGPLRTLVSRDLAGVLQVDFDDLGGHNTPRVQALNNILNLRSRWTDRLPSRVSGPICDCLREQKKLIARLGGNPGVFLEQIAAQRAAKQCKKKMEHDAILAAAYLVFLEANQHERDSLV